MKDEDGLIIREGSYLESKGILYEIKQTPNGFMKRGDNEDKYSLLDQTSASLLRRLSRPEKLIRLIFSIKKEKLESVSRTSPKFAGQPLEEIGTSLMYDGRGQIVPVKREIEQTPPYIDRRTGGGHPVP